LDVQGSKIDSSSIFLTLEDEDILYLIFYLLRKWLLFFLVCNEAFNILDLDELKEIIGLGCIFIALASQGVNLNFLISTIIEEE
jgi:hypothetical protein